MGLGRILADQREARPRLDERVPARTGTGGRPARRRRARGRAGRASRAGAAGRPAGARRRAGDPAESPARAPNDSCHTGQPSRSASATSAAQVSGSSAPAPTTSAGALRLVEERRRAPRRHRGSAACARTTRHGGGALRAPRPLRRPSRPSARSRAPARVPVTASWQARAIAPGTSCGRTGWSTHTGYSPARPCSRPARNGSCARWRRSCWPTTTTSGARLTRAVARAPTALPSPAVVCRIASAGSRARDRPAGRHAHDRALVQGEHEAEVVGQVRKQGDLGRPGIGEERRQPVPAEDIECRVADGAWRHARILYTNDLTF